MFVISTDAVSDFRSGVSPFIDAFGTTFHGLPGLTLLSTQQNVPHSSSAISSKSLR
jgi:hypothetical protein